MNLLDSTNNPWFTRVQELTATIRSWSEWQAEPLKTMRNNSGGMVAGSLALYAYSCYVRRFMLIMCDVLSKVPDVDDRFWRLAVNLYDELGAKVGFAAAHSKLIEGARLKPKEITQKDWDGCATHMASLEKYLLQEFRCLKWPLNLFALGPGTESISDLFLDPLEMWGSDALNRLPKVKGYFDVHRPAVEYEHQLEISAILSEELFAMREGVDAVFEAGEAAAKRVARYHLQAVALCWQISDSQGK